MQSLHHVILELKGKCHKTQTFHPLLIANAIAFHFIGMGKTLEPHMYRKQGDSSVPDIESYIKQKLSTSRQESGTNTADDFENENCQENVCQEDSDDEGEQFEEEFEKSRMDFVKAFEMYKDRVLALNLNNPANKKAMRAFTKTLTKSVGCIDVTIQTQLHTFGKGTAGARKTKSGRIINPNPPAISARLFLYSNLWFY